MKTRDPVRKLLRQFLDAPERIPDLGPVLRPEPQKPPEIPLPGQTPYVPMRVLPPAAPPLPGYNPYIPGRPNPGINPNMPPGLNPYIPQEPKPSFPPVPNRRPPSAPDHAPPAVPSRPPTVASAELSTSPASSFGYEDSTKSQSSKTKWIPLFGHPQAATAPAALSPRPTAPPSPPPPVSGRAALARAVDVTTAVCVCI